MRKLILIRPNILCLKQYIYRYALWWVFRCFHWCEMHNPSKRAAPTSVFPGSFPRWIISEVCSVHTLLTAPSHLYLVIYTYDLGVRRLSIILSSGGLTVSYTNTTSSSHCVCVFDIWSIYIYIYIYIYKPNKDPYISHVGLFPLTTGRTEFSSYSASHSAIQLQFSS